jgi:hypothetical protein
MKTSGILKSISVKFTALIFAVFISLTSGAQTEVEKSHGADGFANSDHAQELVAWYAQPWFWALVAAALVLIIGYMARKSGRVEKTSEPGVDSNRITE